MYPLNFDTGWGTLLSLAMAILPTIIGLVLVYFVVRAAVAAGIARAAEQGHLPRGRG